MKLIKMIIMIIAGITFLIFGGMAAWMGYEMIVTNLELGYPWYDEIWFFVAIIIITLSNAIVITETLKRL